MPTKLRTNIQSSSTSNKSGSKHAGKNTVTKAKVKADTNKQKALTMPVRKDPLDKCTNALQRLNVFMHKYRTQKKEKGQKKKEKKNPPHTHTLTYSPYGAYDIPEDAYHKFREIYADAVHAGYIPHVTEKHKEFGPIVMDFDFKHPKGGKKRYYTTNTITSIIKLYNKVISKYVNVLPSQYHAYVCEKKTSSLRGGQYCDGIHIVYPYICTKPSLQMIMREDFIRLAERHKIFASLNLMNEIDDVVDKAVIYQNSWMMYGSSKNPDSHPYYVTHIYSYANGKVTDTVFPGENLKSKASIHHFVDALSCRRFFSERDIAELNESVDPIELDRRVSRISNKLRTKADCPKAAVQLMGSDVNFVNAIPEHELVEARNLVKILSKKRANDYKTWIQVGMCLHDIDYRLLEDWIAFSKTSSKFKKGECEILWRKMRNGFYSMASLHYFAKKDSPKKYLALKKERVDKLIKNGLECSHGSIAKLIAEKYKFRFKCASIKHRLWYEYQGHKWVDIDSGYVIHNLLMDDIAIEYAKYQSFLYESASQLKGQEKEDQINKASRVSRLIKDLHTDSFMNGVVSVCSKIMYDPKFLKRLDENIYLIGFENGVYDLEADIFRDGCPDDYITKSTNYNYVPYDEDDETIGEIESFIKKIQPDEEMRDYVLTLLSLCLAGSISEEDFYVFTGSGANGKSKLMELMKHTMGELFMPMDVLMLVGKRTSSSSATPELADKKGIRICPLDEPKASDEINTGFMKIFTGGDTIMARALFREPIYFKPQFKPFLLCNNLPKIREDDDGTWRRLKVVPFLSKFHKPDKITKKMLKKGMKPGEFIADSDLSEKLEMWKECFMGMLLKYYRDYRENGLVHPKLVTKHTDAYRKRCDVYREFIDDNLEKTNSKKDLIGLVTLRKRLGDWFRMNRGGQAPSMKDLQDYLQHRMADHFNLKANTLIGYKIKQSDTMLDDLDEL